MTWRRVRLFLSNQSRPAPGRSLAPCGAAHTFGNDGEEPARLLVLHARAADAYFVEALGSAETPPAPDEERALMTRHGMEPG